jgi:hypothetical protein
MHEFQARSNDRGRRHLSVGLDYSFQGHLQKILVEVVGGVHRGNVAAIKFSELDIQTCKVVEEMALATYISKK